VVTEKGKSRDQKKGKTLRTTTKTKERLEQMSFIFHSSI